MDVHNYSVSQSIETKNVEKSVMLIYSPKVDETSFFIMLTILIRSCTEEFELSNS